MINMIYKKLLVCILMIWTSFTTTTVARQAIVGGDQCNPGRCTYMVSIQHNRRHICGGGIIGKRAQPYILTAAHCFFEKERFLNRSIYIVAGSYDTKPNVDEVLVKVKTIYVPKNFNPRRANLGDIAVLELKNHLSINMNMLILTLAERNEHYVNHERAIIAGWGWHYIVVSHYHVNQSNATTHRYDTQLRLAETIVLTPNDRHYGERMFHARQICARVIQQPNRPRGVCNGDDGSPLIFNGNRAIAVLSKTSESCDEREFGAAYTKISMFRPFIDPVINRKSNGIRNYADVYHIV